MGMEKKTKIIIVVLVLLLVIGGVIGLLLGLLLNARYVQLEVWPRSADYYAHWDQPVIQFRTQDPGSWNPWVQRINDFLREYETTVPEDPPRAPCTTQRRDQFGMRSDQFGMRSDQYEMRSDQFAMRSDQFGMRSDQCDLAMKMWAPCTADQFYGYAQGTPCVFLRLTHIHYWVPQPYNTSTPQAIPMDMPENLRQYMHQRPAHVFGDYVWVSCDGEYGADQENIGPIQYIPANMPPGFPVNKLHTADRVPWQQRNMPDQIPPPLVAVLFEHPRRGVLINVECRIWSRDIYYDRTSRIGRARFELFVE